MGPCFCLLTVDRSTLGTWWQGLESDPACWFTFVTTSQSSPSLRTGVTADLSNPRGLVRILGLSDRSQGTATS